MKKSVVFTVLAFLCILAVAAAAQETKRPRSKAALSGDDAVVKPDLPPSLILTSPAFVDGGCIPVVFTCEGEDLSPPLDWDHVPEGTQAFVLICDDPDAPGGTWRHWLLVDVPGRLRSWQQGLSDGLKLLPGEARHGLNSWGRADWGGPCPPPGPVHHYEFTLYALSSTLGLGSAPVAQEDVLAAMRGLILAEARLTGTYSR
jgi:hypothetical protein